MARRIHIKPPPTALLFSFGLADALVHYLEFQALDGILKQIIG